MTSTHQPPTASEERDLRTTLLRMAHPAPSVDGEWERMARRMAGDDASCGSGDALWGDGALAADNESRPNDHHQPMKKSWAVAISHHLFISTAAAVAAIVIAIFALWPTAPAPRATSQRVSTQTIKPTSPTAAPKTAAAGTPSAAASTHQSTAAKATTRTLSAKTGRAEMRRLTLPDGTRVWLDAETQLTYVQDGRARRATLHAGRAYFDVCHDARRPFIVEMPPHFRATDIGTEFLADADGVLTVVSGTVRVDRLQAIGKQADGAAQTTDGAAQPTTITGKTHTDGSVVMHAGQQITTRGLADHIDTYPITQWRDGWFYFQAAPLQQVLREVARWYGVHVVIERADIAARRLHFVARRDASITDIATQLGDLGGFEVAVEHGTLVVR